MLLSLYEYITEQGFANYEVINKHNKKIDNDSKIHLKLFSIWSTTLKTDQRNNCFQKLQMESL